MTQAQDSSASDTHLAVSPHAGIADPPSPDSSISKTATPLTPGFERFNKLAGGVQAVAATVAIIVGGGWALWRYEALVEPRIALANAEKSEAEAKEAARRARSTVQVHAEVSATQVDRGAGPDRWIVVELAVRNAGNEDFTISLAEPTKLYLSRIEDVENTGEQKSGKWIHLKFDYPDKLLNGLVVRPGLQAETFRTVQKVVEPGLYIVRFSTPALGGSKADGREYGAQAYFLVK